MVEALRLPGWQPVLDPRPGLWDVNDAVQSLIRHGAPVDTAKLANPAVPLDEACG